MAEKSSVQKLPKGTVVFRENDPGDAAYILISGRVEVRKSTPRGQIVLAQLGRGQTFGEMALALEKPRSAGVVAVEETVVRRVPAELFFRMMARNPKRMAPFMKTLFERLRNTSDRLTYEGPAAQAPVNKASGRRKLSLVGLTIEAEEALKSAEGMLAIGSFPFKIGRKSGVIGDLLSHNDLYLADEEPFQVSRNHCAIVKASGEERYFVQDRGSALGTVVNGRRLGGALEEQEIELDKAHNELVLGAEHSPYRFQIVLESARD